jgi:hypothetical protein
MGYLEFEGGLRSLERVESMSAEDWDRKAEGARDDLADLPRLHPQFVPPSERDRHLTAIKEAELCAKVARRRASYAQAGYLLVTDAERGDPEFMRRNQSLITDAYRLARARFSGDLDPSPSSDDQA